MRKLRRNGRNKTARREGMARSLCGTASNGDMPERFDAIFQKRFCGAYKKRIFRQARAPLGAQGRGVLKLAEYRKKGVFPLTIYDKEYPEKLLKTLGEGSPVALFCAGNTDICRGQFAGFVGSRNAEKDDLDFARFAVGRTVERGFGVVSGGARGVDNASEDEGLNLGASVVEFPSDGMLKKLSNKKIAAAVSGGKMLLLSLASPEAPFNLGVAMMRNRYIYAQSEGTIVVRADYNKGGTW